MNGLPLRSDDRLSGSVASCRTLLISIHSKYAELIMSGVKRVELRRRFGLDAAGSRMFIYATLPTAAVVGHARIERVDRLAVGEIWLRHGSSASISTDEFERYFDGVENGYAVILAEPTRFATPIPLDQMRRTHGLTPPQSYIFLRDNHRDLVEHEQN